MVSFSSLYFGVSELKLNIRKKRTLTINRVAGEARSIGCHLKLGLMSKGLGLGSAAPKSFNVRLL